jgi:tRNA A37 threonylcarbamoyladenosine modification protein TsaB
MSIAVAQAWQLARGVGLFGLSSAEVMARLAKAIGWRGRIHLVIDAQRDEFYLVVYEVSDAAVVELSPLRLASIAEVGRLAAAGAIVAGPEAARRWPGGRALFPDAEVLGELCAERVEGVSGERLEPIYLRPANFVKALGPRAPTAGR